MAKFVVTLSIETPKSGAVPMKREVRRAIMEALTGISIGVGSPDAYGAEPVKQVRIRTVDFD